MVWFVLALMTIAAVLCVAWPLVRRPASSRIVDPDLRFYREQMAEVDADVARGLLAPSEAGGTRAELGRRLLSAASRPQRPVSSRWGAVGVAVAALLMVPVLSVGLYLKIGAPGERDQPLAARLSADQDIASAVQRVEAHLASHPDDGRGFEVIAPIYLKLGRFGDAANAYAQALRTLGDTPERLAAYGQALVMAADGVVTAQARQVFDAASKQDPGSPQTRYYLGVAAEQDGDKAQARAIWEKLASEAPPDAPWLEVVRRRLVRLDNAKAENPDARPSAAGAASIAALPGDQRDAAIRGMVEGLAARLAQNGHDAEGWLRLVRAYKVLGETDRARQALADAKRSLSDDGEARARLDGLAHELGLEG